MLIKGGYWNTLYYDKDQIYDIFGFCYFFIEIYPDQWLLVNTYLQKITKRMRIATAVARALNQTTPP